MIGWMTSLLRWMARRVLQRYAPRVVAITGSYGKTSAKEAIAAVLRDSYAIRSSAKSFNNEFGVPFTILGVTAEGAVARILQGAANGLKLLFRRSVYPTYLVLEMGADRPGDIDRLTRLVQPTISVLTGVGPTHLQRFGSVEAVLAEKALLALRTDEHGWSVLNGDDPRVRTLAETTPCRIISYGFESGVAVRCVDAAVSRDQDGQYGMLATIEARRQTVRVFLPGVVGRQSVNAALAATAVGLCAELDFLDIVEGLKRYQPPPGRMRVLDGRDRSWLIDDTYNASPDTMIAAIDALREFPAEGRRWAVLGEMADLGSASVPAHQAVGREVVDEQIDVLVTVGRAAQPIAETARAAGLPADRILHFASSTEAAGKLRDLVRPGDVFLCKGSQVSRMERVVEALLAQPEIARSMLVRQDARWRSTP